MKNEKYIIRNGNQLRYDWKLIQRFYDNDHSLRDVVKEVGICGRALQKAWKRGDLKLKTLSEAMKLKNKRYGPSRMGPAARVKLSIEQSLHNRGGKSKWFNVGNQKVQGTWERNLALKFNELNIKWIKLNTGKDVWVYVIDGIIKNYTPDFYLPDFNVYLDPKGYWWGNDKQKIEEVKRQHSDKRLIIIEKDDYQKLLNGDLSILH